VPAWFDGENGFTEDNLPGELYELRADLAQKVNHDANEPAKVTELIQLMETIRARSQMR
jgi:arylsulfatase A